MGVSLSAGRCHRVIPRGEITVLLTWVDGERAMVLVPTYRKSAGWYVICDSAAYQYADDDYLVQAAFKAVQVMGLDQTERAAFNVADAISSWLAELVMMPPEPDWQAVEAAAAIGDLSFRAGGNVVHQDVVTADAGGVAYVPEVAH